MLEAGMESVEAVQEAAAVSATPGPAPHPSAPPTGPAAVRPPATATATATAADLGACRAEPLDLVTVPARQGLEAVDILRRAAAATCTGAEGSGASVVGPVLHDGTCDTVGFLVPPGTADGWDVPGSACTHAALGAAASVAVSAAAAPCDAGAPRTPEPPATGWLLPPTKTVPVTDPAVLRLALGEAARLIEAADRCH